MRLKKSIIVAFIFLLLLISLYPAYLWLRSAYHKPAADTTIAETEENQDMDIADKKISEATASTQTDTAQADSAQQDIMQTPGEMISSDAPEQVATSSSQQMITSSVSPHPTETPSPTPTPHPDRVTYRDGFYAEPLTEDVISRIDGISYHENENIAFDDLRYLSVLYINFNGQTQTGELVCNQAIAEDLIEIFEGLYDASYQIEKIRLVDEYGADDDLSCADNNSSCFNYRVVAGTSNLSKHALGAAVDINPFYNPYITYPNGKERISPPGSEIYADRSLDDPRLIKKGDLCYNLFISHGFTWGGEWKSIKDYQHFQKDIN